MYLGLCEQLIDVYEKIARSLALCNNFFGIGERMCGIDCVYLADVLPIRRTGRDIGQKGKRNHEG